MPRAQIEDGLAKSHLQRPEHSDPKMPFRVMRGSGGIEDLLLFRLCQPQSRGEPLDRTPVRTADSVVLQVTQAAYAHTGRVGQLLLGEARPQSMETQHGADLLLGLHHEDRPSDARPVSLNRLCHPAG
nr:hypothetical protein [Micromonospora sp. C31]